ncbi:MULTISPECIES: hypothetical protein [unclassified Methylobacterium]|uniref:hypothetical protein n=1 Tax=unclassified Methylobacterium TaxID=2615210 RepID=UPI0031456FCC
MTRHAATRHAAHAIDTKYIRLIQQQQIELALVRAERDAALLERDLARARSNAAATLLDAVVESLRPYGFGRKRFLARIRRAARLIPNQGPESVQHALLYEGSNRILGRETLRPTPTGPT